VLTLRHQVTYVQNETSGKNRFGRFWPLFRVRGIQNGMQRRNIGVGGNEQLNLPAFVHYLECPSLVTDLNLEAPRQLGECSNPSLSATVIHQRCRGMYGVPQKALNHDEDLFKRSRLVQIGRNGFENGFVDDLLVEQHSC